MPFNLIVVLLVCSSVWMIVASGVKRRLPEVTKARRLGALMMKPAQRHSVAIPIKEEKREASAARRTNMRGQLEKRIFLSAERSLVLPGVTSRSIAPEELANTLFVYTDGSCSMNRNVKENICPAGWAAVVVKLRKSVEEQLRAAGSALELKTLEAFLTAANCMDVAELYGPVVTSSTQCPHGLSSFHLGASVGSNNTGELCAIGEALLFVKDFARPLPHRLVILFDSEYAAKSVMGEYNGPKNRDLIKNIRAIVEDLFQSMKLIDGNDGDRSGTLVVEAEEKANSEEADISNTKNASSVGISFVHVRAHNKNFFNERADQLAKRGATGHVSLQGRYAHIDEQSSPRTSVMENKGI